MTHCNNYIFVLFANFVCLYEIIEELLWLDPWIRVTYSVRPRTLNREVPDSNLLAAAV